MAAHYFTIAERREHLETLARALDEMVLAAARSDALQSYVMDLKEAALRTRELLATGFTQPDLTKLANSLPDPLGIRGNPHWEPPLQQTVDGQWAEADWFVPIGPKLGALNVAARKLRTVGFY